MVQGGHSALGLDHDDPQAVRDHIVELPADTGALGSGLLLTLPFKLGSALLQARLVRSVTPDAFTGDPGDHERGDGKPTVLDAPAGDGSNGRGDDERARRDSMASQGGD
jgi:hypothetical protein